MINEKNGFFLFLIRSIYKVTKSYVCILNLYKYNINLKYFDKSLCLKMLFLQVPLVPADAV